MFQGIMGRAMVWKRGRVTEKGYEGEGYWINLSIHWGERHIFT
jgi:hypothetical protein